MLKKLGLVLGLIGLFTTVLQAHPGGHDGAIPEEEAIMIATQQVARLVDMEKLASSWALSKFSKIEMKETEVGNEYIVSFSNSKIKDLGKSVLYVFLTETGEYVAANYSGN